VGQWKPHGLQTVVRHHSNFWAKTGASPLLLQWINKGITLPFRTTPPPFRNSNPVWSSEEVLYWETELLPKMLKEGAVREVAHPTPWVSSSRLEPKASGGYRHIVDLRPINAHLPVPKCKYETLDLVPFLSR
jgi:hypothetical protein